MPPLPNEEEVRSTLPPNVAKNNRIIISEFLWGRNLAAAWLVFPTEGVSPEVAEVAASVSTRAAARDAPREGLLPGLLTGRRRARGPFPSSSTQLPAGLSVLDRLPPGMAAGFL